MNINITIYEGNNTLNVADYTPTVTLTVVDNLYQSGGGGAVNSVNGKTGTVVLGANDINESSTRFWLTDVLKTAYDGAVSSIANMYTKSQTDTLLSGKVDKVSGKGLSQNDLTNDLKASYDGAVSGLSNKVDKVTGYGLSKNDLTDSLKSTYDGYASQISAKANKATQRSGTVIAFDTEANYGSIVSPLTGNITGDYTGAILGVVQLLIHNDSVAPTIPATWIKANTSASYTTGVVNFIAITWLSSNIATYTIWKSA